MIEIIQVSAEDANLIQPAAEVIVAAFAEHWPAAYPTIDDALEDIHDHLGPENVHFMALLEGNPVGWIGGLNENYDGHAWELHPLAVLPSAQMQGIGRKLVERLEQEVKAKGATTLYLGTDDENEMTSLSQVDLYTDLWGHIRNIQNLKGHPYSFYEKCGFTITGVIPDANGPGKPDILMAKRII